MNQWEAKALIAAAVAIATISLFGFAAYVGVERTQTCREQPQLCDTHLAPRVEIKQ